MSSGGVSLRQLMRRGRIYQAQQAASNPDGPTLLPIRGLAVPPIFRLTSDRPSTYECLLAATSLATPSMVRLNYPPNIDKDMDDNILRQ
jgi:hypothetical protein